MHDAGKEMIQVSAKLIPVIAPGIQTNQMYHLWNTYLDYVLLQSHNIAFESKYIHLIEVWDSINDLIFSIAKYIPIQVNTEIRSYKRVFGFLIK